MVIETDQKVEFLKKVVHESWVPVLTPLFKSPILDEVLVKLANAKDAGDEFTPDLGQAFNAFKYCTFDDCRVVILGQDPYHQKGVATGVAFANKIKGNYPMSPSLMIIMEELQESVPNFNEYNFIANSDLLHLEKQGVLLLNSALTVELNRPGSHRTLWTLFMQELIKTISSVKKPMIYVFLGAVAKAFIKFVEPGNDIITGLHPAADTYGGQRLFRGSGVFNLINQSILKNELGSKINWEE